MQPPQPDVSAVYQWLAQVKDPEVPVLSILDLGIVRGVELNESGCLVVTITPTYSGCPAMDVIAMHIRMALAGRGFAQVEVKLRLRPAWTTDWMSEAGRQKLKAYGIAPPQRLSTDPGPGLFEEEPSVACPRCGSLDTSLVSRHGATACKSLYQCKTCHEPFEHFKCH